MSIEEDTVATGNCYESAIIEALLIPEAERDQYRLVHGSPMGQGKIAGVRHGHAWLERFDPVPDDLPKNWENVSPEFFVTCLDKSNGKDVEWPRPLYYGIGHIEADECIYFTIEQAFRMCSDYNHYGPWNDDNPPLPEDDDDEWDDDEFI